MATNDWDNATNDSDDDDDDDGESINTDVSEQTIEIKSELTNETNENRTHHISNKTGSMIIKKRQFSLDGNVELLTEMDRKWSKTQILNDDERALLKNDLENEKKINGNGGGNINNNNNNNNKNKPNTNGNNDEDVDGLVPLSAMEEIMLVDKERDILEQGWKKFVDLSGDGDVDRKEWMAGAGRAKIDLTVTELSLLFDYLDKEKTGFIDQNDFCEFMQMGYTNPIIKKIQTAVLHAFGSKHLHQRRQSTNATNLIHKDSTDWGNYDLRFLEKEMQKEMTDMVY